MKTSPLDKKRAPPRILPPAAAVAEHAPTLDEDIARVDEYSTAIMTPSAAGPVDASVSRLISTWTSWMVQLARCAVDLARYIAPPSTNALLEVMLTLIPRMFTALSCINESSKKRTTPCSLTSTSLERGCKSDRIAMS
eukprot:7381627-Prymnesium_polylepis.2